MLGRTFNIVTIADIPIKVHWTFGFFFFWVVYVGRQAGMDSEGILWLGIFSLVLFVCVVLHEYGHALTAKRFGVKTKDIIISPIGGIARLMSMPQKPVHELKIAIAGPLVNLVIAILLGIGLFLFSEKGLFPQIDDPSKVFNDLGNFIPALFILNLALMVFNLIPAFPMDGGRILRSLLSMRLGRTKATRIASLLGQILAMCFVIFGIYRGDYVLAFVGVFVFFSAANEFRMVLTDSVLSEGEVTDVYRSEYTSIQLEDEMNVAIELLHNSSERDFIVLDGGLIKGVLHEEFIIEAEKKKDHQALVSKYFSPRFEYVDSTLSLKHLFLLFQQEGYSLIPVLSIGHVVGVVDRHTLNNYLRSNTGVWKSWIR